MFQTISKLDKRKRLIFDMSLSFVFSIIIVIPIFFIGLPGGADMPQHFQFAKTFEDAIAEGSFYPSWAADPNGGNGSVGNRIYPPLIHYTFVLFKTLTGNWFDGFCLSIILFFFIGGTGMYFWSREYFSESASLFGAITYIFLPYHVNQIYGAAIYAEFAAAAIAPFCFLFTYRVCRKANLADICGLAIAYAFLILSHIPIFIYCSLALLIYALFSLKGLKFVPALIRLAAGVFTGLLLSSFYWSRMITEIDYVNHNTEAFRTGKFSYTTNFLLGKYFPNTDVKLSDTATNFGDLVLFVSIGILISAAVIYFVKSREDKNFELLGVLIFTAFAFFMATPLSMPIWEYVSIMQKTQFPWRWLTIIEIGTAIFAAAAFKPCFEYIKTSRRYLVLIFTGFCFFGFAFNTTDIMDPMLTYPRNYFNPLIERWKSMPSNDCWWTIWSRQAENKRALVDSAGLPERALIENREVETQKWTATERIFQISNGKAGTFFVETFYYPHWKATVNGQSVEVTPSEIGLISMPVATEKSEVRVYFEEPRFVIAAYYISGSLWIIILGFLIFNSFRRSEQSV